MKKILLIILLISTNICYAQEKFSKEIQDISDNIVKQITGNATKAKLDRDAISFKIAIGSIENEDKRSTKLTELIENKIAINLAIKSDGKYDVLDRNYINELLKEKKIPLQYDNKRDFAKNLGRIKAANFIIVGTLSTFENDFELNLQLIETTEGKTIGGATGTITKTPLLNEKNDLNKSSQENIQFQPPTIEKKTEPIAKAKTGSIEINNKISTSLVVLMGVETVEPANYGKQYETLSIAANSNDKFEGLAPGAYYICATFERAGGCIYSKKVIVEAGKNVVININSSRN